MRGTESLNRMILLLAQRRYAKSERRLQRLYLLARKEGLDEEAQKILELLKYS